MWLKYLCLILITSQALAADDFLSHLYGLEQRNKVVLCLKATPKKQERNCTGALLHDQWVGVRAGCLRLHPLDHVFLLRTLIPGETCNEITNNSVVIRGFQRQRQHEAQYLEGCKKEQTDACVGSRYSRTARAVYYHPWADLAMVNVDMPYFQLDRHPNSTKWTVPRAFKEHGTWKWMKKYIDIYELERDPYYYYYMVERTMIANRRPLLVMFLTIVLPILLLVLVFVYTVHYSDSSSDISYKNLQYTKKAIQI